MNAAHTPGPLNASGEMVFSESGSRVADFTPNDNDEREMPEGEEDANARLIAAAPELWAALAGLLQWMVDAEAELGTPLPVKYAANVQKPVAVTRARDALRAAGIE